MDDQQEEEQQDQQVDQVDVPDITATEDAPEEEPKTKSVKNFWERLDEVFIQNTDLKDRFDEILEQFPSQTRVDGPYRSVLFQPARLAISSNDDIQPSSSIAETVTVGGAFLPNVIPSEYFSQFRVRLPRPLINVKSIQLLSCVVPNAVQNIPDNSTYFVYYKLRSVALATQGAWSAVTDYDSGDIVTYLGNTFASLVSPNLNTPPAGASIGTSWIQITPPVDTTRPNYFDITYDHLQQVNILPSFFLPERTTGLLSELAYNRTFTDYPDLLTTLNYCATQIATASIPGDVSFQYSAALNKFILVPNPAQITAGYYYFPAGYEDPNVAFLLFLASQAVPQVDYRPTYTLNLRLGFTWNGLLPSRDQQDPWTNQGLIRALFPFMRKADPLLAPQTFLAQQITANSYGDLVNTSCVRIYTDVTMGSTEDSISATNLTAEGLLSIVPVNATNLGVSFYQNNFSNPLTRIPQIIPEIGFRLTNDQGLPFNLPNSATVLLELAVTYY
jgi:hypothetical protein